LELYDGILDPREYVAYCIQVWEFVQLPSQLWVHQFIHSLINIPSTWNIHEEAQRQTVFREVLQRQFCQDFLFSCKSLKSLYLCNILTKYILLMNLILYILLLSVLNMSTSFIIVFTHLLLDYLWSVLLSRETQNILMTLRNLEI